MMLRQSGTLMETMSLGFRRAGMPNSFSATSKAWGAGRRKGGGRSSHREERTEAVLVEASQTGPGSSYGDRVAKVPSPHGG